MEVGTIFLPYGPEESHTLTHTTFQSKSMGTAIYARILKEHTLRHGHSHAFRRGHPEQRHTHNKGIGIQSETQYMSTASCSCYAPAANLIHFASTALRTEQMKKRAHNTTQA